MTSSTWSQARWCAFYGWGREQAQRAAKTLNLPGTQQRYWKLTDREASRLHEWLMTQTRPGALPLSVESRLKRAVMLGCRCHLSSEQAQEVLTMLSRREP